MTRRKSTHNPSWQIIMQTRCRQGKICFNRQYATGSVP